MNSTKAKIIVGTILLVFLGEYCRSQSFKPKFLFGFDNRGSHITLNNRMLAPIMGIKLGVHLMPKWRFGLGGYRLANGLKLESVVIDQDTISADFKFQYLSLYGEYIFYNKNKLELSIPAQLGWGSVEVRQNDALPLFLAVITNIEFQDAIVRRSDFYLIETSIAFEYKLKYYIGLGGGLGYRLVFLADNSFPGNFSSVVYDIKALFYIGPTYRVFRDKFSKNLFYSNKRLGHYKSKPWESNIY